MIRKKTLAFALAGAFAIGSAGVLHAQVEQKDMGTRGMMQHCPMMMGMGGGPDAALRHAESLDLTPDQIERLESLREETGEPRRATMERMREIHREIAAAATGEAFDEAAVRAALDRVGDLHEEIGVTMLRARHVTSRVLTAEQSEALAGLRSDPMEGMSGMGMMEMMKHCPIMRGHMGNGSGEVHGNMRHQGEGGR